MAMEAPSVPSTPRAMVEHVGIAILEGALYRQVSQVAVACDPYTQCACAHHYPNKTRGCICSMLQHEIDGGLCVRCLCPVLPEAGCPLAGIPLGTCSLQAT